MKYYVISGEASGDLHGGNLLKAIQQNDPHAQFRCWGGEKMQAQGATIVKHYRELAFMGFVEVIQNLPIILSNISFCKKDIESFQPDALILIDYPGFNLRIAKWAKSKGFKVIYYISPTVWAWKENRVKLMRECIDLMLVILPFEEAFYKERWNWKVEYVGHPLLQAVDDFTPHGPAFSDKPVVAVLPGSRKQEISVKLPVMLKVSEQFPEFHFVIAMAPGMDEQFYQSFTSAHPNVSCVSGRTYDLLHAAKAAMVTSGTATLETALFNVPQVVCYRGGAVSFQIAKWLVNVKYISLVNLILDRPVVKELIQYDMNEANLLQEMKRLLHDSSYCNTMKNDYATLREMLTSGGNASAKAASLIAEFLSR